MRPLKALAVAVLAAFGLAPVARMQSVPDAPEAPTGFDTLTNGHTDQATMDENRADFEEAESVAEGLGPIFNANSCAACHLNPVTGGIGPVAEFRAGHRDSRGNFVASPGSSLIHSNAIDARIQEVVPDAEYVRTFRTTTGVMGLGFVEAIANDTLVAIRSSQPGGFVGTIVNVPVVEATGTTRIGRFGWKDQQASLLSFAGDAYVNEMGITNHVPGAAANADPFAVEDLSNGRSVAAYDQVADPEDDGEAVQKFADFMRATKAPPRGPITAAVNAGATLFAQGACSFCHTPSITTAPAGTLINGGALHVSAALGGKTIHPYSDFLLHDVGTGDGIVQNGGQGTANMLRTPPLWGVRIKNRLMHDGLTFTLSDAILRHAGTGGGYSRNFYQALSPNDKANLIAFLNSL
jgi:CxxC motif-containing protein (DUF1111 family)